MDHRFDLRFAIESATRDQRLRLSIKRDDIARLARERGRDVASIANGCACVARLSAAGVR